MQRIRDCGPDVVAHAFNLCTLGAEASRSLRVQDQPGLHSEFQASQALVRIYLNNNKNNDRLDRQILEITECSALNGDCYYICFPQAQDHLGESGKAKRARDRGQLL